VACQLSSRTPRRARPGHRVARGRVASRPHDAAKRSAPLLLPAADLSPPIDRSYLTRKHSAEWSQVQRLIRRATKTSNRFAVGAQASRRQPPPRTVTTSASRLGPTTMIAHRSRSRSAPPSCSQVSPPACGPRRPPIVHGHHPSVATRLGVTRKPPFDVRFQMGSCRHETPLSRGVPRVDRPQPTFGTADTR
jgi:hypothetical protein